MNEKGWVYFIKSGIYCKIGISQSTNIRTRLLNYRTHNPHKLKLLELIYVDDCKDIEKSLHSNIGEEWVVLQQSEILMVIRDMKSIQSDQKSHPDYKSIMKTI